MKPQVDTTWLDTPDEEQLPLVVLPAASRLQDALHERHAAERQRTMEVLSHAPTAALRRTALRMAECGRSVQFVIDPDTRNLSRHTTTCNVRLCPICGKKRARKVAEKMILMVRTMREPRHLVLTVKSESTDLRSQLTNLRGWFAKLRATAWVKAAMSSGVYTIEATVNPRTGLWHPHLHVIYDGAYMPHKRLRIRWHEITGGSEIVWIEAVHERQGAVNELCKYVGKPQRSDTWTDALLVDYARAVHGARMVQTFGKKPAVAVDDAREIWEPAPNAYAVTLSQICWLFDHDTPGTARLLELLSARWPDLGRYIYQRYPQLKADRSKAERIMAIRRTISTGPDPPPPKPTTPPTNAELEAEIYPALVALHPLLIAAAAKQHANPARWSA